MSTHRPRHASRSGSKGGGGGEGGDRGCGVGGLEPRHYLGWEVYREKLMLARKVENERGGHQDLSWKPRQRI